MADAAQTDDEIREMIEQAITDFRNLTGGEEVYIVSKARWSGVYVGYQQRIATLEQERERVLVSIANELEQQATAIYSQMNAAGVTTHAGAAEYGAYLQAAKRVRARLSQEPSNVFHGKR